MGNWQATVYHDRRREGDEIVDEAIRNSKRWCQRNGITRADMDWLDSHGYCPWAAARGVVGNTDIWLSRFGISSPIYLRNRVCYVDGHQGSDLDPGTLCIHCGLYEGDRCLCGSPKCWLCEVDDV